MKQLCLKRSGTFGQQELLEKLQSFGLQVNDLGKLANNGQEILEFYQKIQTKNVSSY